MLAAILKNTPPWVWGLLAALIALGVSQSIARTASLRRVLVLPAVMTGFSVFGTASAFGWASAVWLAWAAGGALVFGVLLPARLPEHTCFDTREGTFFLPASAWPLLLILGIFLTKYGVGVVLAMQPHLAQDGAFSPTIGFLYGAFSGIFLARAARLWRLAKAPEMAHRLVKLPTPPTPLLQRVGLVVAGLALLPVLLIAGLVAFGGAEAPPVLAAMGQVMAGRAYEGLPELAYFTARDGSPLAYRAYPGSASGRRVAVLVHGSSGDSHAMHGVARALQAQGITAYALDMRGHGASGRRGDVDYVGQLDDDIADLMVVLRARHAGAQISLVGHSSGGGFALRTAGGRNRDLFDRYVLLAPLLHQDAPTTRPNAGGWVRVAVPRLIGLSLLDRLGVHWFESLPVLVFALPPEAAATHTASYSYRLQSSFRPHADYLGDVRGITRPVRVLVGDQDELFVAAQYAPVLEPVQPLLKVDVLPEVGHLGVVTQPAALAAVVAAL